MISTEKTRALAEKVFDFIATNPASHDQESFIGDDINILEAKGDVNICDTTMCIAGTAVYLDSGVLGLRDCTNTGDWVERGANLLGLDHNEAEAVFYEFDNERAVQKLKKIVVGEEFNLDDFNTKDRPDD